MTTTKTPKRTLYGCHLRRTVHQNLQAADVARLTKLDRRATRAWRRVYALTRREHNFPGPRISWRRPDERRSTREVEKAVACGQRAANRFATVAKTAALRAELDKIKWRTGRRVRGGGRVRWPTWHACAVAAESATWSAHYSYAVTWYKGISFKQHVARRVRRAWMARYRSDMSYWHEPFSTACNQPDINALYLWRWEILGARTWFANRPGNCFQYREHYSRLCQPLFAPDSRYLIRGRFTILAEGGGRKSKVYKESTPMFVRPLPSGCACEITEGPYHSIIWENGMSSAPRLSCMECTVAAQAFMAYTEVYENEVSHLQTLSFRCLSFEHTVKREKDNLKKRNYRRAYKAYKARLSALGRRSKETR